MAITPEQLAGKSEQSQQIALFCWASLNRDEYPQLKWLHAIPNANSHKMVAEGVRGGILDIFLPVPLHPYGNHAVYAGLYIEMKTEARRNQKNGGLSDEQIDFIDYAKEVGYAVAVCYSWIEARDVIIKYLSGE